MIGKGIIRGKSYSVIKRHKITQCCKRRKSSSFVFLLSLVTLSCWGFYVLKVYLSVSTFACLNPIFYSSRSNHLQIQIKSVKRLLKTPQLLLIVHRIKSKHLFVAYKAVMIWLLPPSLTSSPTPFPYLLTSSHAVLLSSLWGMSFHLQKLWATVLYGMFNFQIFSWLHLSIGVSLTSNLTSSEGPSLPRQIRHRCSPLSPSFRIKFQSSATYFLPLPLRGCLAVCSTQGVAYSKCWIKNAQWMKE